MLVAPAWVDRYIGIPYAPDGRALFGATAGVNCWGLIAGVWRERYRHDVSDYDGPLWTRRNTAEVAAAAQAFAQRFLEIPAGDEREGDGMLLRPRRRAPMHVGLVVCPGLMLHVEEGCDSVVEEYRSGYWQDRVDGFYRVLP